MSGLQLGIDTGGTYTDAVLVDHDQRGSDAIVASAKSLTTRHDLSVGIGKALDGVLESVDLARPISFVSISTTLATNAIVEGQGERVCLVAIGFEPADLERGGLAGTVADDHLILIDGGHTAHGVERCELDTEVLSRLLADVPADVAAFAVVGHFAVRNPEHELSVRDLIVEATGKPVTCSHELTAKLNGPKRALTCVLNARLVGLIGQLLDAADQLLSERGITCPRMVVRGDGSLVSLEFATTRPIETILSGPAASLVGASFLAEAPDAIVSDIGGTTTDIAVLRGGRPEIDRAGARVGGHQTMVEAVAMRTSGLGGDSEVRVDDATKVSRFVLGPRRVIPVSSLAAQHPDLVHGVLDKQRARLAAREHDASFGRLTRSLPDAAVEAHGNEFGRGLLRAMADGPIELTEALSTRRHEIAFSGLVDAGLAQRVAVTPTDAAHVLGFQSSFDLDAAEKALDLLARRQDRHGAFLGNGAVGVAQSIIDSLVAQSANAVLDVALAESGIAGANLAAHPLTVAGLSGLHDLVRINVSLGVPLVAVGASANAYYRRVAEAINADVVVPTHAEVANAVGAVVGQVRMTRQASVSPLKKGRFRAHVDQTDFDEFEDAVAHTITVLTGSVEALAADQGAQQLETSVDRDDVIAEVSGRDIIVESVVTVTSIGRPEFA